MKRSAWLILGAIAVVAFIWYLNSAGRENVAIDLVQEFGKAEKRPAGDGVFESREVTLAGTSLPGIITRQQSRITWKVTVPDNGKLKVSMGLLEEAWGVQGDGVLFLIGVTHGADYEDLLSLMVNPFGNPSDKRWNEVQFDLSQYSGEEVSIIFNTRASAPPVPGQPQQMDGNGDFAVWGAPRIVVN